MAGNSNSGRPSKGDRTSRRVRIPEEHATVYDKLWERLGYKTFGDYAAVVLAQHHGLEVPKELLPRQHSETPLPSLEDLQELARSHDDERLMAA